MEFETLLRNSKNIFFFGWGTPLRSSLCERSDAELGSQSPLGDRQARLQDEERANLRRIGEYLVTQANDINFGWGTGRFEACSASAKREAEWGSHTPPKLPLCHSERAERVELFRPRSQTLLRTI